MQIPVLDLIIVFAYMAGIVFVGLWVTRNTKMTGEAYFLGGRSLRWPMIGAALFASNISTIHLVGLCGSGYATGLVWGNYEWMAPFTLLILAMVFAPFYFRNRVETLPEYLEKRFGSGARSFMAFMGILGALFIHIGMSLYAGAKVFEQFFGIDVMTSILVISAITAIYTVVGGLKAVVVTETIQTVLLIAGSIVVTVLAVQALPGAGIHSWADLQANVKPDQLSVIWTDPSTEADILSFLMGYWVLGVWYWSTDQTIVQRVLAARSEWDAQIGPIFAGFLKVLPMFILVFPGVLAYALYRDQIGADADQALPFLIQHLVPTGLRGLITAGLLAALMSTIAAALNSCATLVAVDIVARMRPGTTDREQVQIGRWAAIVIMLLAIAWSTQGEKFTGIFAAVQQIGAALAPPITAVFVMGVFSKRGGSKAALWTLMIGLVLGVWGFLVDTPLVGTPPTRPLLADTRLLTDGLGIPFLRQAFFQTMICMAIFLVIAKLTPPPPKEKIEGLTWDNPLQIFTRRYEGAGIDPRYAAAALVVTMLSLYTVFR
ncbi:MAG: sodium/solute symporter [Bryobacterales bacterium]|nr:sodium:solute symporter [Acidobacteriota bacterium]MCB9384287.1 sodium/solute symporter [Bryobacterales bacterium]